MKKNPVTKFKLFNFDSFNFQIIAILVILNLLFIPQAFAVCPLCTFAVGAGIGLAQWLGIDDSVTGLWIGGFTVSLIAWTINWLNKKNIRFFGRKIIVVLGYYAMVIVPLCCHGIIGHALNKLWGVDKLLLGMSIGSLAFVIGTIWYEYLKKKNQGKAYFPFQKVVMPVAPLLIGSIIFYYLTK